MRYKWEPVYPEDEAIDYTRRSVLASSSHTVGQVLDTLAPEERARFEAQILRSHQNLVKIGEEYRKLGAVALSRPDPVPRRQVVQRKTHGRAGARGLTAAEIAGRQLDAREKAEKAAKKARDRAFGNLEGESQGGTSITVGTSIIRSPERPIPRAASPSFLPASTAPPRLQLQPEESSEDEEEQVQEQVQPEGRGKRRRIGTASYKEAREQGLMGSLGHSQHHD